MFYSHLLQIFDALSVADSDWLAVKQDLTWISLLSVLLDRLNVTMEEHSDVTNRRNGLTADLLIDVRSVLR
jgi:hypothetical protein